ncbi:MAG: hypothetical protein CL609_04045 [Anaerolineaceae bacterium]|nr:hypothetical protein [Anaerolineaceae bacterium]
MNQKVFEKAANFIWLNARLLERYRFSYHFHHGSKSAVLTSLKAYQNPDGGFGNALEPDKRYPGSNAMDVMTAFYILDEINAMDDPMVREACDFLVSASTPEGGLPFTIPQINSYPHSPWMGTDDPYPPASINPTGDLVGLLLKHNVVHPWLEKAVPFCWQAQDSTRDGFHDIMPAIEFLKYAPNRPLAEKMIGEIKQNILIKKLVNFDRKTEGYLKFPLDWAPSPNHVFRSLFSDQKIKNDLDALVAMQQDDGGWPINWPPLSKAVEMEWRGIRTLQILLTLRAYQYLS